MINRQSLRVLLPANSTNATLRHEDSLIVIFGNTKFDPQVAVPHVSHSVLFVVGFKPFVVAIPTHPASVYEFLRMAVCDVSQLTDAVSLVHSI